MFHVTLIENNQRVISILKTHLLSEFGADVYQFDSAADALHDIEDKKKVDHLILVRNKIDEEESANVVVNKIYDQERKVPVIVMGEFDHASKVFETLPDRFRVEELNRMIIDVLNIEKSALEHHKLPDYIPFPIANFYLMDNCSCDVFIKLKKKEGDQFIKRMNANDEFDKKAIKKYEEMNVGELYIEKEHRTKFMNQLLEQSIQKIKETQESGKSDIEVGADSFEISHNLVQSMGISSHSVQMGEAAMEAMANSISTDDRLGSLLHEILAHKGGYSYKRSYLISLFSYEVIPLMGWGTGEQLRLNFEKMIFVAYFHDILITKASLLRLMNSKDFKEANLTLEERELVLNHANETSTLIQSYPHAPQGADVIIRQHHGMANGIGFPEQYVGSISSMAIVFIVIETFVAKILDYDMVSLRLNIVLDDIADEFTLPSYRKVVEALRTVVGNSPLA